MTVYKLSAYPKQMTLRDGRAVTVRPLEKTDGERLKEFFLRVSPEDRYFLRQDVTSPRVVAAWTDGMDYDRSLPVVALAGDEIVADAVLLRGRYGAYRNVAEVRVVVDERYRNQGLGTMLVRELCDVAADAELERVVAELVSGVQDDAINAMEQLGFIRAATVHEHLRDEQGRPHDLVVMVLPLGKWYQWSRF
ncbi:MAG TPA: GNAT family N-acetyltransferase [Dehalococcoidia bacterium]|nr:GNAT family N-acetyltransferase [Dehalococcoidia bacterium]